MRLHKLGDGLYALGETGWTVERETWDSVSVWTVRDSNGVEKFDRPTRGAAVEEAIEVLGIGDTE